MNRWICVLVGLWRSLWHGANVSGHDFVEDAVVEGARVEILRCEICGHYEMGWSGGRTVYEKGGSSQ